MSYISFVVPGVPISQGSPKIGRRGKKAIILLDSEKLRAWRGLVTHEARVAARSWRHWVDVKRTKTFKGKSFKIVARCCFNEPVVVHATFYFEPPKSKAYGDVCHQKPDLDKLHRAIGDALEDADIVFDDCRIVGWPTTPAKLYGKPRVEISVESLIEYEANATPPLLRR